MGIFDANDIIKNGFDKKIKRMSDTKKKKYYGKKHLDLSVLLLILNIFLFIFVACGFFLMWILSFPVIFKILYVFAFTWCIGIILCISWGNYYDIRRIKEYRIINGLK